MIFTRLAKSSRPSSAVAMALVLAATGAAGIIAMEQPAYAQKKKKDKEEAKPEFSKEFVEAYNAATTAFSAENADYEAVKGLLPTIQSAAKSADERGALGQFTYSLAVALDDEALKLEGLETWRDSGTLDASREGSVNYALYQTYRDAGDVEKARGALERAIAANYTVDATMSDGTPTTIGPDQMTRMISQLYFDQERHAEGIAFLADKIEARKDAGQPVPESWIRTGLASAYNNDVRSEVGRFLAWLVEDYPADTTWGDAVVFTLNSNDFSNAESVDLFRLARRIGKYNDPRVLSEYVEVLNPIRFPGEVVAVVNEGRTLGAVDPSDTYIADAYREAEGRVAADRAELASMAKDADAPGADLKTLMLAGDLFLSYDQPGDAERFYTKALGMSGVETPTVLTRLGIAQYDQGKYAEAIETFKKVEGARRDVANLWAIYAAQKSGF